MAFGSLAGYSRRRNSLSCWGVHVRARGQIYSALSALSEHEAEVLAAVLPGAACVWVGSGFVPAARVAFRCLICRPSLLPPARLSFCLQPPSCLP
jgi:hypothetical protein